METPTMNHVVPSWIERLLGINTEPGEGMVWSIECAWPWPPWVTLLLAALAVVFVVAVYWRENPRASQAYRMALAAVRLAILGLVLLMIAQFTLSLHRTGLPYAAVLIDDSQSMTVVDHYADKPSKAMLQRLRNSGSAQSSRWSLLQALAAEHDRAFLRGVADGHKLRVYFLTGARASRRQDVPGIVEEVRSTAPTGESSRLGAGIRTALDTLRGATPAAVVVLTDGVNTDGPSLTDAAEYARRRGVPLYFVGFGGDRPVRDLKLFDLMVDDVVFVDDVVTFECKLSAAGFEGRKVSVVLREKDKPATPANVLARTEVTIPPDDRPQQVRLQYRPTQVGQFEYVVEVEPQADETLTENNRQTRIVQVRKEKIRVLLVQAYPNFEFRYLRNMLGRDETIALHTVLQEADPEYAEQDASSLRAFPLRREDLFAYDVVIFGDVNPALLNSAALQNLADFVDQPAKGGALVLIAGPSYMPAAFRDTPLARLLPFAADRVRYPAETLSDGFVVQPTDLGLANPSMQLGDNPEETQRIWKDLPPLYWLLEVPVPELKPGVRVLAEHPTRVGPDGHHLPVFCFQYVGAGKVLFHATDETWRWRYRVGDLYFARYWIQTIRYLSRSKLADAGRAAILGTDRREYTQGDSVRLRVRFADERLAPADDDGVTIVVEQSGRKTQRISLHRAAAGRGVFEGTLDHPGPGSYHTWIAVPALEGQSPAADFTVLPPPGEFAQVRMDAAAMRRAAEISGGRFYTFDAADRLLRDLPPGRPVPIESLPARPLWNRWPVLALLLGLLIAEWILRKRRGMV
jgi:hypothetical protein